MGRARLAPPSFLAAVAIAIACTWASGALADPVVSGELPLDAPSFGPLGGTDVSAAVGSNGSEHLVVWRDMGLASLGIVAERVDPTGTVVDAAPIVVTPMDGFPAVASNGTDFLVVWGSSDLFGRRISAAGVPLDAAPFVIVPAPGLVQLPSISVGYDGSHYVVAWQSGANAGDVFVTRVDPSGAVLDASPIPIAVGGAQQTTPDVACQPALCLVTWLQGNATVMGARIDANAALLDPAGIAIASGVSPPSATETGYSQRVAFDGTNFVVVHRGAAQIRGSRVSPAGSLLDAAPFAISNEPFVPHDPVVTGTGSGSLVVWTASGPQFSDVHGVRLDTAGTVLDAPPIPVSQAWDGQAGAAIATAAGKALVAFLDYRNATYEIYGARVDAGAVLDPDGILLSRAENSETEPSVASDGAGWLAVWSDSRGEAGDIVGTRLDATGAPTDAPALLIGGGARSQHHPRVARGGSSYLAVWEDDRMLGASGFPYPSVFAARVDSATGVLDPDGIAVAASPAWKAADPAVACGPTQCLVAWVDQRNASSSNLDIYATRIDASGAILDAPGLPIVNANGAQKMPSIDWDGTNYLVVWRDARGATPDVYAARVTTAGVVLDANGFLVSTDGLSTTDDTPDVAWDGARHLVVWNRDGDIAAARVGADGALIDPASLVVSNAAAEQSAPSVSAAGDGHDFVVGWQDTRSGVSNDVYAAWLNGATGQVVRATGVAVAAGAGDEQAPALAGLGGGRLLALYEVATAGLATRVEARLLDSDSIDGTPCNDGAGCASGVCGDGFCCEHLCDAGCETCGAAGSEGVCTCTGLATCASNPSCKLASGIGCADAGACASGFCADGVCCDTACDGGCDRCDMAKGVCSALPAGTVGGAPACLPGYVCVGQPECPTTCPSDASCAPGFYCSANAQCTAFCGADSDCPPDTRCDAGTGKCVAGATCDGDHRLTLATGETKDCSPYRCLPEGQCRETCATTADCAGSFQCDEHGACATPPGADAGDGGCGCSTPGAPDGSGTFPLAAALLALRARRRRARRGRG